MDFHGPAHTFTPINAWDLQLNAGGSLDARIPDGHTALAIVQDGNLTINNQSTEPVELMIFEREGELVEIRAETASRILLLSGEPIAEPIFGQGPFVMNSPDEIQRAIQDFQSGKMGSLS